MTSQKSSSQDSSVQNKASVAYIGPCVLVILVMLVALLMSQQDLNGKSDLSMAAENSLAELEGFNKQAWLLPDEDLLGFVKIPAGTFIMGSNPSVDRMAFENERWSTARRQGTLSLPEYYIGRYEVTVAQYRVFLADTVYKHDAQTLSNPDTHPVNYVSWTDALAYGRWLELKLVDSVNTPDALQQLLAEGAHITLPSEAQWEKAARGSRGKIYPWGSQPSEEFANYRSASTKPVGSFECPDCENGLADMSGNVWELTRSPYQAYPYSIEDDRDNLQADALWVMRGGSYSDEPANIRAAIRGGVDPGVRNATIGFRLVLSVQ
ncbi:MAG: hypothetical protein COC19_01810 [SAR86 cluster bacterium]|uniref:Sulfatase-modifying factor enzyme-like domain-containing protein n=1 Tax=SAR86 cluster bacterium TaxID=2030880 RepID=A0A2A4MTM3_9GAMM|nr:MAG: hypothetical protein COC19_01810 [SAR86 cluster bacterium]